MSQNDKGRSANVLAGAVSADCVAVILYTTFPTHEAAVNAGRTLVERRLVGCVNILPSMTAVYVWDGRTEVANEAVLLAKMPGAAFAAAADAVYQLHPYETPAILALPIAAGLESYLEWLSAGSRSAPDSNVPAPCT